MTSLKLYMVLLGCKPDGRHTEQHDVFFGIAPSLKDLVPEMKAFWKDSGRIHIDAWREVTAVEGHQVVITPRESAPPEQDKQLFFINLGGYQENRFEEQHYIVLTVKPDRGAAIKEAKNTLFYQHNHFNDAVSHVDDKYGIDVDDIYQIEDILSPAQKALYSIALQPAEGLKEDEYHLGYLKIELVK